MNSENPHEKNWHRLKEQYLQEIEEALIDSSQPNTEGIVADVRFHLDRRYAELPADERNWENFQKIITQMGPPSEYAELAGEGKKVTASRVSTNYVVVMAVILAALTAGLILLPLLLPQGQLPTWTDKIRSVIEKDPELVGKWVSVDFVSEVDEFRPGERQWQGDLFLKELTFNPGGTTDCGFSWTKGWIIDRNSDVRAKYEMRRINSVAYLFFPWLSGDVTIRGMQPKYYVLKKVSQVETQQAGEQVAAIEAAECWLQLVDDGAYGQSWMQAAEFFRKNVTEQMWNSSLEGIRRPLGKMLSRKVKSSRYSTEVPGGPDGQYVIIQFETSFENKSRAVETVTPMLEPDGRWRVSGYYIK